MRGAEASVSPEFHAALETAAKNIREYAELQLPRENWVQFPRRPPLRPHRPAARIHGRLHSRRPLSAALHAADDRDPRAGRGRQDHLRHVAASERRRSWQPRNFSDVENVFRIGGAQAIAALAFGTATIPKVDRIVGPGNIYVAAAKKAAGRRSRHRFHRRPHRDRDHRRRRRSAAHRRGHAGAGRARCGSFLDPADHFAQHWPSTWRRKSRASSKRFPPRRSPAKPSAINSAVILCPSIDAAVEASNRLAPEHLAIYDDALLPEDPARGQHLHRAQQSGSRGRLRIRPESRASHLRRGADSRRPVARPIS